MKKLGSWKHVVLRSAISFSQQLLEMCGGILGLKIVWLVSSSLVNVAVLGLYNFIHISFLPYL